MDTRNKIATYAQARTQLAEGNWLIVAGYFDPLTASIARRLRNLVDQNRKEKLLAVVLDVPGTLLSAEARSFLIAALRAVNAVLSIAEEDLSGFIPTSPRIRFVFDREAERSNSDGFSELVLRKKQLHLQSSESGS